jgi:amino acid adenylation domain-containing protein
MMISDGLLPGALLPLQQGMVLHLFADSKSGVDVQQCIGRSAESLDFEKFVQAWQSVLNRHAGLRTSFHLRGFECSQKLADNARVVATLMDWRALTVSARETAFEKFLREDRVAGFTLTECPVWRITAFDYGPDGFQFVFTHPHAIVDAQSAFIILRDLFAFYDGTVSESDVSLPPAGSFVDFMRWHEGHDLVAAEACWKHVFRGFGGRATPLIPQADASLRGSEFAEVALDAALSERIRAVAAREKVALSAVIKAIWAIVLSRISGTHDVVFGEVRSGRRKEVANMDRAVGMFVATVPVRIELNSGMTFRQLIEALRGLQSLTRDHEHTSLQDIQRWCGLAPGESLFDTALVFDHVSVAEIMKRDGGAWLNREISYREQTSVPITLNVTAEPTFVVKVSYDRSRFSGEFMKRIPGYFQELLAAFAADPNAAVDRMNMLPARERERLLVDWNRTQKPFDTQATIPAAFSARAQLHATRVAVVSGNQQLSYGELEQKSTHLSMLMRARGVGRGTLVGICMDRTIDMLVAMLASMKSGAGYVPLDPSYPDERLRFVVDDARPALIVVNGEHGRRFQSATMAVMNMDETLYSSRDLRATADDANVESPTAADVAYVIYTSGSTGRPKGVPITQRNVANCFAGMDDVLPELPTGIWLAVTSISFDISVIELFWTLTRGYTVVICRDSADAPEITRLLQTSDISHLQCTPSLVRMLVADPATRAALTRLRVIMLGGEALPSDLPGQLVDGSRPTVINVYGPTETTIWSTAAHVSNDVNIGRPIANTQLYVLDGARMPLPAGIPGELYIGGDGVARGYLNRPELTAERFIEDPFSGDPQSRLYRTGDLVRYRENGTLDYLGRLDNQVKIFGHRIELGEIESALQQLPEIESSAVVARVGRTGEKQLVAYVTLAQGVAAIDSAEVRAKLRTMLPEFEIPSAFVTLSALPLTPNLKIDRKALPEPDRMAQADQRSEYRAPRTDAETRLARLWEEVLSLTAISIADSFFALGGNSLKAVQLLLGIRDRFGVDLSPNVLYQNPTIEALAQRLGGDTAAQPDAWAVWQHPGRGSTTPPVIGLHGVDDIFVPLARRLGVPVHTLTSRVGFDGRVPPYFPCRSIEDMAERYLAGLRSFQPRGPYVLLGFCLGGLITYEVAIRLTEAGEDVAFLGLFNAPPPRVPPESHSDRLARHWRTFSQLDFRDKVRYVCRQGRNGARDGGNALMRGAREYRRRLAAQLRPVSPVVGTEPLVPENLVKQISQFGLQMVGRYRHRRYRGRLRLFYGAHWPPDYVARWSRLAGEGATGFLLPGGHLDMMEEPHVQEVVARLAEQLPRLGAPEPVSNGRSDSTPAMSGLS